MGAAGWLCPHRDTKSASGKGSENHSHTQPTADAPIRPRDAFVPGTSTKTAAIECRLLPYFARNTRLLDKTMPAQDHHAAHTRVFLTVIVLTLPLWWLNTACAAGTKTPGHKSTAAKPPAAKPPAGTPPVVQVDLTPRISAGDLQQVKLLFELDGQLTLRSESSGPVNAPVKVKAQIVYDEKTLQEPTDPKSQWAPATVRHYETARATITFPEGAVQPSLREDRRIVAVSAAQPNDVLIYSPLGPLSRDELDLIDVPANSAMVDGLLPARKVAVGEKWKLSSNLLPALLNLDRVTSHNVHCTLDRVDRNLAMLQAVGTVTGATGGVSTDLTIAAKWSFDLTRRRISWFAMSIKEKRALGHAHPGLVATVRIQMSTANRSAVPALHAEVLADLNLDPDAGSRLLEFQSPHGGFALLLDRNWHVMVERQDVSVLRLVDRGDLVAQCNISALPPIDAGEQFTILDFQEDVRRALESNSVEFAAASESLTDSGLHVMRVVATGRVSELPIEWVYYHIADQQGRRASCVFTYESELSDRFAASDQAIVSSFHFTDSMPDESAPDNDKTPSK